MSIVSFIVAVAWGLLSGQFFIQVIMYLVTASICLIAIFFSKVRRSFNTLGFLTTLGMGIFFATLTVAGNFLSAYFVDYSQWSATTIACVIAFLFSVMYCVPQMPGKLLVTRLSAWRPFFQEAASTFPPHERVAFAVKTRDER